MRRLAPIPHAASAPKLASCFFSVTFTVTCAGLDIIAREQQLPVLRVGDWIIFERMGAYTIAGAWCVCACLRWHSTTGTSRPVLTMPVLTDSDFNGFSVSTVPFFYMNSD